MKDSKPAKRYRLVYVCESPRYRSGPADEREWTTKSFAEVAANLWPLEHSNTRVKVEEFWITEWF